MNNNKLTNLPTAGGLVILLEGVKMTFIIKKGNEEIAKSESKVVTFPNNVPYPIGTVVPAGTYTALNRNFWGDSASAQVPEFEIINSKKPDPIVETKITVIPGSTTANITDNTDRLTSTDDHLNLYDGKGNLIFTSDGKTHTIQLTGLTENTTYNNYKLSWSNSYGETYKVAVPTFSTVDPNAIPVDPKTSDLSVTAIDTSAIIKDTSSGSRANEMMILYSSDWKEITEGPTGSKSVEITGLTADTDYPEKIYYVAYRSTYGNESHSCSVPEFTTSGSGSTVVPESMNID